MILPTLALLFILTGCLLLWISSKRRKASGLPGGRIIYSDTRAWGRLEKPLYDSSLGLTGKPDYLIDQGNQLIPVEVKSSRAPESPYDSHIFQLAAYCLLVDKALGKRPPYGIIHYTDHAKTSRSFAIDYTPELEGAVLDLLNEIRSLEKSKEVKRSHDSTARCKSCGYALICEEKLQG
jgi:CRISPR-associated exonuclease Cas4